MPEITYKHNNIFTLAIGPVTIVSLKIVKEIAPYKFGADSYYERSVGFAFSLFKTTNTTK